MTKLHLYLGIAVLASNGLAAAWGAIAWTRRDPSAIFWYLLRTAQVIVVNPRTKARECMALMTERNIRHLPVVDEGRVLGMISIRDIVGDIIADQDFTIEQLEHYISGQ